MAKITLIIGEQASGKTQKSKEGYQYNTFEGLEKAKPIPFNRDMVEAIMKNLKTQTRRLIKLRDGSLPEDEDISFSIIGDGKGDLINGEPDGVMDFSKTFPYWQKLNCRYKVDDVLYVKENTYELEKIDYPYLPFKKLQNGKICYYQESFDQSVNALKTIPSMFMSKEKARIFLRVKSVGIQRINDITEKDAKAEGVKQNSLAPLFFMNYLKNEWTLTSAKESFCSLWNFINKKIKFEDNPYVWVIQFERITTS